MRALPLGVAGRTLLADFVLFFSLSVVVIFFQKGLSYSSEMTSHGLGEMFEGNFADTNTDKILLMSILPFQHYPQRHV